MLISIDHHTLDTSNTHPRCRHLGNLGNLIVDILRWQTNFPPQYYISSVSNLYILYNHHRLQNNKNLCLGLLYCNYGFRNHTLNMTDLDEIHHREIGIPLLYDLRNRQWIPNHTNNKPIHQLVVQIRTESCHMFGMDRKFVQYPDNYNNKYSCMFDLRQRNMRLKYLEVWCYKLIHHSRCYIPVPCTTAMVQFY